MQRHMYLSFGTPEAHQTWIVGLGDEPIPGIGSSVSIALSPSPTHTIASIEAEIRHRSWVPGSALEIIAYGGLHLPPPDIQHALTVLGCQIVDADTSHICVRTVLQTPSQARGHEVLLIMGHPGNHQVWRHYAHPRDAVIPVFGQRVYLPLYAMEYATWSDVLAETRPPEGTGELRGQVFYAAKSDTGDAHIGIWSPDGGDSDGFQLLASRWEQLGVQDFHVDDFDVWQRVELAHRTTIFERSLSHGGQGLDVELAGIEALTSSQVALLPYGLQHVWRQHHTKNLDGSD